MSEIGAARLWAMRLAFALLVCLILFFHLLPLDMTPNAWIGPDYLLAFAFAWSLRRPEFVPVLGLALLFLLADLLLQRPPGLWALCALLACERLKIHARGMHETSLLGEWLTAAIAVVAVALCYRLGLALTLVPLPAFGLSVYSVTLTVLFYPLAAAATHWAFGVRRPAPGERDSLGGGL